MNIVLITTGMRPDLLVQSLTSIANNATDWSQHHLTLVIDGHDHWKSDPGPLPPLPGNVLINTAQRVGASAARNIGAGSIPKYRRQEHVLFLDDDVYMAPGWDTSLSALAAEFPGRIISGYSHPFNQTEHLWRKVRTMDREYDIHYGEPLVISSVAMMLPWSMFDAFGPWDEPGGPGASEDYALCMRAKRYDHGFAVTDPQCVIHTGLISSKGEKIVGYQELAEQNDKLLDVYGIRGKVQFG
jgi:GT2 family glycosyltransferase